MNIYRSWEQKLPYRLNPLKVCKDAVEYKLCSSHVLLAWKKTNSCQSFRSMETEKYCTCLYWYWAIGCEFISWANTFAWKHVQSIKYIAELLATYVTFKIVFKITYWWILNIYPFHSWRSTSATLKPLVFHCDHWKWSACVTNQSVDSSSDPSHWDVNITFNYLNWPIRASIIISWFRYQLMAG